MNTLRRLLPYLRPYRKRLTLALAVTAIFTLLSLLPPLLIRSLVDDIIEPGAWEYLPLLVGLIVLAPVLAESLRFLNMMLIMLASQLLLSDMRKRLFRKLVDLPLSYHADHASGMVVSRLMDDVNMLQRLLTGETVQMLVDLIVFIFSISIVFSLSPKLGGMLLALLLLYRFVYKRFADRIRVATERYRSIHDRIAARLQETLGGVRQVRIYNREESENELFLERTSESLSQALESRLNSVRLSTACMMIAGFGSTVICGVGAMLVVDGDLTYGALHAINIYVWMAIQPTVRLTNQLGQMNETFVSIGRILEILDTKVKIVSDPDAPSMPRGEGRVELRDVVFGYSPGHKLYKGLNLCVEPGETVALVGPTGCGKTTLTKLLMRQWDVQGGQILIDGTDIRSVRLRSLRSLFGVVLQDPVIFDMTLAQNIGYGVPYADRESIEQAARAAEIHELAERLPDGYDTLLGTYGVKLSVGEKQRISIARAILKDPVILVMDEATSSLDSESEALIQKALSRVLVGRTSFIVAHRLSTITGADKIVVMRDGAIVEQGRHEDLLEIDGGLYRRLYEELRGEAEGETA